MWWASQVSNASLNGAGASTAGGVDDEKELTEEEKLVLQVKELKRQLQVSINSKVTRRLWVLLCGAPCAGDARVLYVCVTVWASVRVRHSGVRRRFPKPSEAR